VSLCGRLGAARLLREIDRTIGLTPRFAAVEFSGENRRARVTADIEVRQVHLRGRQVRTRDDGQRVGGRDAVVIAWPPEEARAIGVHGPRS
jgi:hypothetical protein